MQFKNDFERLCFEAARAAVGSESVDLQHNTELVADFSPGSGVISFTGPPKKEIDVLITEITSELSLLISAKDLENHATPAMVQEWASVVQTMNKHATNMSYLGLIVSSCGFSRGCGAWAIDSNLGLVPPYKGQPARYCRGVVPDMLERVIHVSCRLAESGRHELRKAPNYYWSVYKCVADYSESGGDDADDDSES